MNTVDFSQTLPVFKELAKHHPHIAHSEYDSFLRSNESNFLDHVKHVPFIALIMNIIEKSHNVYLALIDRENESINLLHNIKNEPTKAITNYLKKIEMANTLYSQIMFEDDTNYFPLIEQILNDFKNNPIETMKFFQKNRDFLDQKALFRRPSKNGYKDLYTKNNVFSGQTKESFYELKKQILINYYYELLQAYPIITKDIKQIQKKLYTSASIKIFKLLQLAQFQIKSYRLKEYIEELFIALEYPIKVYPDKIDKTYSFALYGKHYIYRYLAQDDSFHVYFPKIMDSSYSQLSLILEDITQKTYPYDFGYIKTPILSPLIS